MMRFNYEIHSTTTHAVEARGHVEGYDTLRMAMIVGNQKLRQLRFDCLRDGCEGGCCCYHLRFYNSLHAPYAGWERYLL